MAAGVAGAVRVLIQVSVVTVRVSTSRLEPRRKPHPGPPMIHHDVPLDLGQPIRSTMRGGEAPRPDPTRVRWALIQRVRREIALGEYERPEKWEVVVDRLLERGVL
jgi:hypothetical protein